MTEAALFILLGLAGGLLGLRLGAARLGLLAAAMAVGGVAACWLGPFLHAAFAALTGRDTLLGLAMAGLLVHAATSLVTFRMTLGLVPRPAARRSRLAGGVLGLLPGLLLCGAYFAQPMDSASYEPAGWVQRPFVLLRSFRLLRSVTPEEAEFVCSLPEVRAVAESEPVRRLSADAELMARIDRAAEGGRLALLELAAEPELKRALDDPELIALVRRVDLPAVAGAVARRRAASGGSRGAEAVEEESRPPAWRIGHALGSFLKEACGR